MCIFPFQRPHVVAHHCAVPAALIPLFLLLNIMVKYFAVFLAQVPKIFLKEIKIRVYKMKF